MVKKLAWGLLALLLALAAVLESIPCARLAPARCGAAAPLQVDEAGAAQRLAEAVRLRTISSLDDPGLNADQFRQLHALLQARFPKPTPPSQREVVGT